MQSDTSPISIVLPRPAPIVAEQRLLLYAIRRMGAHGLNDAHAANALFGTFGRGYRRPLILLRVTARVHGRKCARVSTDNQDRRLLLRANDAR
jgi:hypothetical protein